MRPRIAVVGLGWMGHDHARVLAARADVEVVAVIDRNRELARDVAEQLGVACATELSDVLDRVDAVSICTPDAHHEELALAALAAGARVLVEKPLTTTVTAAVRILAAAGDDASRVTVGHLLQHDARVERARLAVGSLGELWHLRVRRHASRAVAEHVAGRSTVGWFGTIHDAELLLSFVDSPVIAVRATGRRGLVSDTWDVIDAHVEFADGVTGTLHESWTLGHTRPNRSDSGFTVVGSEGSMDVELGHGQVLIAGPDGAFSPDVFHYPSAALADASDLQTELDAWVRTLLTGRQHGVDGRRAAHAVAVVDAIHVALETGDTITPKNLA